MERKELLLALQSALIGEIYSSIRGVAFQYIEEKKYFKLIIYLDRKSNDEDKENSLNILNEFISNFKFDDFNKIETECIHSILEDNSLNYYDGLVFLRKERNGD